MVSMNMTVRCPVGLHLRPAGVFASEMMKYDSEVHIVFGEKRVNAKSLLSIMSACIKCGSEITVECSGNDEEAALRRADELISKELV